jgi:hypothetical protein
MSIRETSASPIGLYVLGDASLVVAIVAFQTVVVTPMIVGLLDDSGRRLWTLPLRVPVVLASAAGVLCIAAGVHLPSVVLRPLELLGGAAVPVALFALGMSLNAPLSSLTRPALLIATFLKIVAQPLAAWAIAHFVFGLTGTALLAVVLFRRPAHRAKHLYIRDSIQRAERAQPGRGFGDERDLARLALAHSVATRLGVRSPCVNAWIHDSVSPMLRRSLVIAGVASCVVIALLAVGIPAPAAPLPDS